MRCHQFLPTTTRRAMLQNSAAGFGSLALAALAGQRALAENQQLSPLTAAVAACSSAGEAGDLSVHVGRAESR